MTDGLSPPASTAYALDALDLHFAGVNLATTSARLMIAIRTLSAEQARLRGLPEANREVVLDTWRAALEFLEHVMPDLQLHITVACKTLLDGAYQMDDLPLPRQRE